MVSFVVPVYNGEKYIERSLKSIVENTGGPYEIIVIDDGSKDKTLEIINKLKKQYCEIKVFSQKNSGVSSARETGIKAAIGEWIVFVDADDYIISDITEFIKIPQCESCDWIIFSKQFRNTMIFDLSEDEHKKNVITAILNQNREGELGIAHLNSVWAKAYKRNIIEKHGIQFEKRLKHGEDMIFNLDYVKNCIRIYCCPECVYMVCANESSATHRYQVGSVENDREFYFQLSKRGVDARDDRLTENYYRMVLNGIWICLGQYFSHRENKKVLNDRAKELALFLNQEPYKTALLNYSAEKKMGKKIVFVLLKLHFYKFVLKMMKILKKSSEKSVAGSVGI